jgi:hypothetical protein
LRVYVAWVLVVAAVLVVIGLYVMWTARRLDRLHVRADTAASALEGQLIRRATVAAEFAATAPIDPAVAAGVTTAVLNIDAGSALDHDRESAESALTRALMACFTAPPDDNAEPVAIAVDIHDEAVRATLARRFFNDTVRDVQVVRELRVVRWGRLAGHAPVPSYFEMDDDELPLARISVASGPTIEA